MATTKWDFLPTELREDLDGRSSSVRLDDGVLQDVVSRAAMPANMLAILFHKLSTDTRVPSDARRGLEYLLYFIDGKKDGVDKNAQKMDFMTFFLSVSEGLKNWPVEVARSLQALALQHAMYKICNGDSTDICMLQLEPTQHTDGVIRKLIVSPGLKACLNQCAAGSSISAAARVPRKGSSLMSTRTLAVLPLSEWKGEHWKFAQSLKLFASKADTALMEKELLEACDITQDLHVALADLLQTKESVSLMDDGGQAAYHALIDEAEFTLRMSELRDKLLVIDFDIEDLLDIEQPTPGNYKKSWGRVKWTKFLVYFHTVIQKTRSVGVYDVSSYGGTTSSVVVVHRS